MTLRMARSLARVIRLRQAGISVPTCNAERESFTLAANLSNSASYDWPVAAPVTVGVVADCWAAPEPGFVPAPAAADAGGSTEETSELVMVEMLAKELSVGAANGVGGFEVTLAGGAPTVGAAASDAGCGAPLDPDANASHAPTITAAATPAPMSIGMRREVGATTGSGTTGESPSDEIRVSGICVVSPPMRSVGVGTAAGITLVGGIAFGIAFTAATSARPNSLAD